jgi:WXG100 family type VII secretion target
VRAQPRRPTDQPKDSDASVDNWVRPARPASILTVDNERQQVAVRPTVRGESHNRVSARYQEVGVSGIRVTPEQLAGLSSRVSSGSASIEGELRSLTGSLAPLGSDWAGVAQQRFQALWAEWQKSAEGLREALGGISQLLGQASTSYAEAERQIAASFGTI